MWLSLRQKTQTFTVWIKLKIGSQKPFPAKSLSNPTWGRLYLEVIWESHLSKEGI